MNILYNVLDEGQEKEGNFFALTNNKSYSIYEIRDFEECKTLSNVETFSTHSIHLTKAFLLSFFFPSHFKLSLFNKPVIFIWF